MLKSSFWSLPLACLMLYGQDATTRQADGNRFRREAAATKAIAADFGDATLWLNPATWLEYSKELGAVRFNHVNKHVLG